MFETIYYPGGELQVRLENPKIIPDYIKHRVNNSDNLIELLLKLDAVNDDNVDVIIPYLPYARADRRFVDGDCFGLEVFAKIINTAKFKRLKTYDVHSNVAKDLIPRLYDLSPIDYIEGSIYELWEDYSKPVVVFPDEGARVRYNYIIPLLDRENIQYITCTKVRDPKTGKLSGFQVPKFGGHGLIIDDICDGGGTFLGIGEQCNNPLSLYVTHGIFSKGIDCIFKRFIHIFTTNSIRDISKTIPSYYQYKLTEYKVI